MARRLMSSLAIGCALNSACIPIDTADSVRSCAMHFSAGCRLACAKQHDAIPPVCLWMPILHCDVVATMHHDDSANGGRLRECALWVILCV